MALILWVTTTLLRFVILSALVFLVTLSVGCGDSSSGSSSDTPPPPLIFVPGYGMSSLRVEISHGNSVNTAFNFLLPAMNPVDILPPPASSAKDYAILSGLPEDEVVKVHDWLKLDTLESGQVQNRMGVQVKPVSSGKDFVAECPRYQSMANKLAAYGWTADDNLFCLPYDYRFPPASTAFVTHLRDLVDTALLDSASSNVVLACHSQGCLLSYYALREIDPAWLDEKVLLLFSFAGQFSGCSDCLRWAFQEEWSWDTDNALASASDQTWAGELALDLQESVYGDRVLYTNGNWEYRADDVALLLNDAGALAMLRATNYYRLNDQDWFRLGDVHRKPLTVESRFVYGNGIPTTVGFDYEEVPARSPECLDPSCAGFSDQQYPGLIQANGDGGDNAWMNEAPKRWTEDTACDTRALPGVSHMKIVDNSDALGLLVNSVRNLQAGQRGCVGVAPQVR